MARLLEWDKTGEHLYETGVDRVVLYKAAASATDGPHHNGYQAGVAWNGCTGITEKPSGGDETKLWADNIKYLSLRSAEDYGATITAYTYPPEWEECDGSAFAVAGTDLNPILPAGVMSVSQQPRKSFALCFRTLVGNDLLGNEYGYKLHILYGCTTSPSEKTNSTVNESPSANEFSWEISTTPVDTKIDTLKPTARVVIDVAKINAMANSTLRTDLLEKVATIEDWLYGHTAEGQGGTEQSAQVLLPDQIYAILSATS